jgi:hypothetical protein
VHSRDPLGTEWRLTLADYFTKVLEDNLKAVVKPQYVDQIPKAVKGSVKTVEALIEARAQMNNMGRIMEVLGRSLFGLLPAGSITLLTHNQSSRRSRTVISLFFPEENCSVSPSALFVCSKLMCMLLRPPTTQTVS